MRGGCMPKALPPRWSPGASSASCAPPQKLGLRQVDAGSSLDLAGLLTSDTLPPRWPFLPSDWSAFALFSPPPLPSSSLLVVILFKCPGPLWGNPSPLPADTL